jgi:hypothetical protein
LQLWLKNRKKLEFLSNTQSLIPRKKSNLCEEVEEAGSSKPLPALNISASPAMVILPVSDKQSQFKDSTGDHSASSPTTSIQTS